MLDSDDSLLLSLDDDVLLDELRDDSLLVDDRLL